MALLQKLTRYIQSDSNIQAAFLVGSQARSDCPADEYSDVDTAVVTGAPERYLYADGWLEHIGTPRVSFVEDTFLCGRERRILFESGEDLDIPKMPNCLHAIWSRGSSKIPRNPTRRACTTGR